MLPITITPAWIEDSRLDHLPPFSARAKVAVAASGKARKPTGFAGSNFRLDVISDCEHQPGPIPCTRELQGRPTRKLVSRSWAPEELAWGTGEVLCPAAAYKKARLWRAFLMLVAGTGFEPVTFR
ncbi:MULTISPECIES: hypothetical protein, partial [unclassified Mesorhizobium]|uniref:hypothetical protein n=1 Tax=unclassified Mesorhizobium TaxID=325217 RepID=UPI001AEE88A0